MTAGIITRRRTVLAPGAAAVTLAAAMLADSPAVLLKLDESSGATANDSSGNSRHVTLSAAPTWGANLAGGGGATVSTQHGSLADAAWMESANITVEAWIKTTTAAYAIVADRRTVSETFSFQVRGDTTGKSETCTSEGSSVDVLGGPAITVNDNARHQIVLRAANPSSNRAVDIIVDGSTKTSATYPTPLNTAGSSPLWFFSQGSGGSRQFAGTVAYIGYYTTALSDARIAAHYAAA